MSIKFIWVIKLIQYYFIRIVEKILIINNFIMFYVSLGIVISGFVKFRFYLIDIKFIEIYK